MEDFFIFFFDGKIIWLGEKWKQVLMSFFFFFFFFLIEKLFGWE